MSSFFADEMAALTAEADQVIAEGKTIIRGMVDAYRHDTSNGLDPALAIGTQIMASEKALTGGQIRGLLAVAVSMLADLPSGGLS